MIGVFNGSGVGTICGISCGGGGGGGNSGGEGYENGSGFGGGNYGKELAATDSLEEASCTERLLPTALAVAVDMAEAVTSACKSLSLLNMYRFPQYLCRDL